MGQNGPVSLHWLICKIPSYQFGWLVVLGFKATLTAKVISWLVDAYVFPGFLTSVLTQLFFPKPPTTFLTCFCRGERRKKSRLNRERIHNPEVMSPTRSPLSHPGGAPFISNITILGNWFKT